MGGSDRGLLSRDEVSWATKAVADTVQREEDVPAAVEALAAVVAAMDLRGMDDTAMAAAVLELVSGFIEADMPPAIALPVLAGVVASIRRCAAIAAVEGLS